MQLYNDTQLEERGRKADAYLKAVEMKQSMVGGALVKAIRQLWVKINSIITLPHFLPIGTVTVGEKSFSSTGLDKSRLERVIAARENDVLPWGGYHWFLLY